jgi:hypothetical protein
LVGYLYGLLFTAVSSSAFVERKEWGVLSKCRKVCHVIRGNTYDNFLLCSTAVLQLNITRFQTNNLSPSAERLNQIQVYGAENPLIRITATYQQTRHIPENIHRKYNSI